MTREIIVGQPREMASEGVRDPQAATQALSYSSPGMRQIPEWDSDSAIREAYLSSVIVFACVRTRAFAFSGCPLRAVLPGKDIADHDPNAPLAKLLGPAPGGPNPTTSARRLWANAITNKIVTGKFAWELEMPMGASAQDGSWAPVGLWPLVARYFDAVPTDGGSQLFQYFTYGRGGFAYGPNAMSDPGGKKRLEPSQVFYNFVPSLNDNRQASSPLQAARYDISADVLQSVYDVAFLRNDARPAGIIVHEAFEDAAERRAFEQQFDSQHRGVQNANRTAFAETAGGPAAGSINWVQIGVTQRDAQMLAVHNDKAQRICVALSVPMSLLDASGRTFSNAGMEERSFWLDTMLPDLADMEDEINLHLAPRLGPHLARFDTSHVVALQPPARFLQIKLDEAVDRKIITPVEARQEMGFPEEFPVEDFTLGATMSEYAELVMALAKAGWDAATIARIVGIEAPPPVVDTATVVEPPPTPLLNAPATPPTTDAVGATWTASLSALRGVRDGLSLKERRTAFWRQADAQTRASEGAWVAGLRRLFKRQEEAVTKRLTARSGRWSKARDAAMPHGDVAYADPGYQADGVKRYPVDTEAHAKAAWSYINMPKNAGKYSAPNLAKVKAKIKAALKRLGVDVAPRSLEVLVAFRDDALAGDFNPDDVFDPTYWAAETEAAVTGLFESLYAAAGARVAGQHGVLFDITNPRVQAQISYRASELAKMVTETTYDAIRSVILNGLQVGATIPEISAGIETVFAEAAGYRADMIARTETIRAAADGSLAAYQQAQAAGALDGYGKVWIGTDDDRECPECSGLDGEIVPFDSVFSNQEDGPPDHPNCRCALGAEPLDGSGRSAMTVEQVRTVLRAVADGHLHMKDLCA